MNTWVPSVTSHCSFPVERLTLQNGLRIVLQPDPQVPLVVLQVSYGAGARAESADRSGLAHLCEHLAFTGPSQGSRGNYPTLVQGRGGVANATTSPDHSRFNTLLPSRELPLGLWVEGQRLSGLAAHLDRETLEVQRKVLLEERRQRVENRPYGRAIEQLHQLLYPSDHPYHRPPAGSFAGLRAITAQDVEDFFTAYYTPRNAVLTLAGDLRPDEIAPLLEELASIPGGDEPLPQRPPELGPLDDELRHVAEDRVPALRAYVGYRAAGIGQKSWHAAVLLSEHLAVGRTSSLKRELIHEQSLAQDVDAYLITMRDASTIAFSATAAPGVEQRRLEDALITTCERLLSTGMTEPVMRQLQKRVVKGLYHKFHDLTDRAAFCTNLVYWPNVSDRLVDVVERFSALDRDDLVASGLAMCQPTNRAVLTIVPMNHAARRGTP